MLDIVSFLLGTESGRKKIVVDGDNVTVTYDSTTKTVTLTNGGDNNNG